MIIGIIFQIHSFIFSYNPYLGSPFVIPFYFNFYSLLTNFPFEASSKHYKFPSPYSTKTNSCFHFSQKNTRKKPTHKLVSYEYINSMFLRGQTILTLHKLIICQSYSWQIKVSAMLCFSPVLPEWKRTT